MEERIGLFRAYGRMWKKCFDYRGSACRREYWYPVLVNAIIAAVDFLCAVLELQIPVIILTAYLTVCLVPGVALTVRRLHDTGKRGLWTLLLLVLGIGTVIIMWMCAASATGGYDPIFNYNETVYGPPEWLENSYRPDLNMNEDVYGPPEWFDSDYQPPEM